MPCMLLQCDQSSQATCSGELPGSCQMSQSQCPFPGCSPVCRVVCACRNPPQHFGLPGVELEVVLLAPVNKFFNKFSVMSHPQQGQQYQSCQITFVSGGGAEKSAVYRVNRKGAKTVPCGAPILHKSTTSGRRLTRTSHSKVFIKYEVSATGV